MKPLRDFNIYQMTLHEYLASIGKSIRPSSTSEAICNGRRKTRRRRLNSRMVGDKLEASSSPVLNRAEELRSNLDPRFPSFAKLMLRSHVTKGFWLGIPADFSTMHLPKHDQAFILEDENGEEYLAKFIAGKVGLSGGWRAFACAHKLLEGDAVVCHLVSACKFKVYVVRATRLGEADGALSFFKLENTRGGTQAGQVSKRKKKLPSDNAGECERSTSFVDFKNFNITVDNLNLDLHIAEDLRLKYYDLCRAQESYLHAGFLKSISSSLAAGIISDTVKIAHEIKSSRISTSQNDFAIWDKTLEGFESLGMEVGFLRARVSKLSSLSEQWGDAPESSRYKQAKLEHNLAGEEVRTLEVKLQEAQQVRMRLNLEMEALNGKIQRHESRFSEEANAPW